MRTSDLKLLTHSVHDLIISQKKVMGKLSHFLMIFNLCGRNVLHILTHYLSFSSTLGATEGDCNPQEVRKIFCCGSLPAFLENLTRILLYVQFIPFLIK